MINYKCAFSLIHPGEDDWKYFKTISYFSEAETEEREEQEDNPEEDDASEEQDTANVAEENNSGIYTENKAHRASRNFQAKIHEDIGGCLRIICVYVSMITDD